MESAEPSLGFWFPRDFAILSPEHSPERELGWLKGKGGELVPKSPVCLRPWAPWGQGHIFPTLLMSTVLSAAPCMESHPASIPWVNEWVMNGCLPGSPSPDLADLDPLLQPSGLPSGTLLRVLSDEWPSFLHFEWGFHSSSSWLRGQPRLT